MNRVARVMDVVGAVGTWFVTVTGGGKKTKRGDYMPTERVGGGSSNGGTRIKSRERQDTEDEGLLGRNGIMAASRVGISVHSNLVAHRLESEARAAETECLKR